MSPAFESFRSPENTAPAMISACARVRLPASPRLSSSSSARTFAMLTKEHDQVRYEYRKPNDRRHDRGRENGASGYIFGIANALVRLECNCIGQSLNCGVNCLGQPHQSNRQNDPAAFIVRKSEVNSSRRHN